jgi:hypothetical protein
MAANTAVHMDLAGSISSTTKPIARVIVSPIKENVSQSSLTSSTSNCYNTITAIEETADIPARPIHITVLEGLNQAATINLSSFAVLTGIPDSTNVFISNARSGSHEVYDYNAVEIFLRSITNVLPRAFTVGGHGRFTTELTAMYGDEETTIAFQAMSFSSVAERIKKIGETAKKTGKELESMLRSVEPVASSIGGVMSTLPGPVGQAGRALTSGSHLIRGMKGV